MYNFLAKLCPGKLREGYINILKYSGIQINHDRFIGFVAAFGFLLSLTIAIYSYLFFKISPFISLIAIFFLFQVLVYFWLMLKADTKAKFVDSILPDVLQLMASNLRAGMTTDRALLLSARPEFGVFKDELNSVGKEITTGKDIGQALLDMSKKIRSDKLGTTMALIVSGIRSGGKLSSLLEQTSKNLRQEELVDSRIRANEMMYVIFIFIAVCFGAPLLFGLSSFLVEVLTRGLGEIDLPEIVATTMPITITESGISANFVIMFAVIFLLTSSILGSLILGLISKGKEKDGIKFIPILSGLSLGIFFLVRYVISSLAKLFGF